MGRLILWRLVFFLLLSPGFVRGADSWALLKIGMTAEETAAAIGEPLFRSAGRGFELWIYDQHAEVLFFGSLIGWTTPGTEKVACKAVDVWQGNHNGANAPTFLSALPVWLPAKSVTPRRDLDPSEIERPPTYRFRH